MSSVKSRERRFPSRVSNLRRHIAASGATTGDFRDHGGIPILDRTLTTLRSRNKLPS